MTTQKWQMIASLERLGIKTHEAMQLRRISLALHRWAERECGDGSNWAIERDETTGKPFNVYHGEGKRSRYPIADKEAGALRRLAAIMAPYKRRLVAFHQGDCRGAALYIIRKADVRGQNIEQVYNRGVAVY